MKTKISLFVIFVAAILVAHGSPHQGMKKARTLEDYRPATLKELAALQSDTETPSTKGDKSVIQGDIVPSRVTVVYTGSVRPMGKSKKNVIAEWAARFAGMPEFYTGPYDKEVLFTEGGRSHWLAVKNEFLPKFGEELRKGEIVDLYLIQLGRIRTRDQWEPVWLVESFEKTRTKSPAKL